MRVAVGVIVAVPVEVGVKPTEVFVLVAVLVDVAVLVEVAVTVCVEV